jgi:hypothetical protein
MTGDEVDDDCDSATGDKVDDDGNIATGDNDDGNGATWRRRRGTSRAVGGRGRNFRLRFNV